MEAGTGDTYAVVMIDLDDLKEVNDTYGHESGDQYIISAAEILKKIVGEKRLTARHGGDEFVLFLEEKSEEALQEKLLQLKSAQDSSEAVLHDGQHVPLRFSMGCCFIDEVAAPYDEMLEKADIAMYEAKKTGKNRVATYCEGIDSVSGRRLDMEKNMRDATVEGYREFEVYYQHH